MFSTYLSYGEILTSLMKHQKSKNEHCRYKPRGITHLLRIRIWLVTFVVEAVFLHGTKEMIVRQLHIRAIEPMTERQETNALIAVPSTHYQTFLVYFYYIMFQSIELHNKMQGYFKFWPWLDFGSRTFWPCTMDIYGIKIRCNTSNSKNWGPTCWTAKQHISTVEVIFEVTCGYLWEDWFCFRQRSFL